MIQVVDVRTLRLVAMVFFSCFAWDMRRSKDDGWDSNSWCDSMVVKAFNCSEVPMSDGKAMENERLGNGSRD